MSQDSSQTNLENVKISKTTSWSFESNSKALTKIYEKWVKAREVSDVFAKKHAGSFIQTLYLANVEKDDGKLALLDSLRQDIVGGNQVLSDKLWGFKEGVYLVLPNNKNIITSALLRNMLKLAAMSKTPCHFSDKDLVENSDQINFWSGFFSELYSESPLKRIAPIDSKTSMYATGVACMRYELYNMIRKESIHIKGQYWYPIDKSIVGDPNKKTKKYLSIFLGTYANGGLLSRTVTQLILSYYKAFKGSIIKRVDFSSFLKDGKSTLALLNRYKVEKTATGKGKKVKTVNKRIIIKPTKPSRLATIFAFERGSIAELTESAWLNLEELLKDFEKTIPLKRNYDSFTARAKELIDEQWKVKQIVLNASKFRQNAVKHEEGASVNKKILAIRKATSSEEVINKNLSKEFDRLYVTLFSKLKIVTEKGFSVPTVLSFLDHQDLKKKYPITYKLIAEFHEEGYLTDELSRKENLDSVENK